MTTGSKSRTSGSVKTIIATIAVLVIAMGTLVWRVFSGEAGPAKTLTAQQRADQTWIKVKARESGGDFEKLTKEDQQRLVALYGKMASAVLRGNTVSRGDNF